MGVRKGWVDNGFQGWEPGALKPALFAEYRMLHLGGGTPSQLHFVYLLALDAAANGYVGAFGPWTGLTEVDGKWFVPEDLPHLDAYNSVEGQRKTPNLIDLTLMPEPYVGRLAAPIVLLSLNPYIAPGDHEAHADPAYRDQVIANPDRSHRSGCCVISTRSGKAYQREGGTGRC